MAGRVVASEDGFSIRGIEPPGLNSRPDAERLLFWNWALEIALKQKDRDLSMGLDKDGKSLRPISAATRKHRHSEMTPGGKGDPSAPPLEPGRQKSRVRSLLTGKAFVDHIELWWKFDPFTGDSFARVLERQAEQGRDVFGLSPGALLRTAAQAWERFRRWEAGKPVKMPVVPGIAQARPIEPVGTPIGPYSTSGIGPAPTGQFSGGMRIEDWIERMRQPARVAIPGRPGTDYNRILGHIWGTRTPPAPKAPARPKPKPKPPEPARKAALRPASPVEAAIAYGAEQGHRFEEIGAATLKERYGWSDFKVQSAIAFYDWAGHKLYINADADLWQAPDPAARMAASGRWFAVPTPRGTIDHEIGHARHHEALRRPDAPYGLMGKLLDADWKTFEEKQAIIREVSGYAAYNPAEFVAEVYSALKAGRTFPDWIMDLYREWHGVIP